LSNTIHEFIRTGIEGYKLFLNLKLRPGYTPRNVTAQLQKHWTVIKIYITTRELRNK